MRERTRFEDELELLGAPAVLEAESPPPAPAWPPKALRGRVIFRHWRIGSGGGGPVVLIAADLDPGFADNAHTKSCLADWQKSTAPSAQHSHIALVDLSHGDARYAGHKDTVSLNLVSTSKAGLMYPAFQLRRDARVLVERDKPATAAALFNAMRDKWAADLVDAGTVGNRAAARRWVNANGPALEKTIDYQPGTPVSPTVHPVTFVTDFWDAVSRMIINSSNPGRTTCINLLKAAYINSVLSQSGAIAAFNPIGWSGTVRSVAAMLSLIAKRRLVSAPDSAVMWKLLRSGATAGAGTWTRHALKGADDETNASLTRRFEEVGGKIGYLHGGNKDTWWDNVTTMADGSIVTKKGPDRTYVLVFAIPFHKRVIRQKDVFPLIRAIHDCI
jgi:hypothetical protein